MHRPKHKTAITTLATMMATAGNLMRNPLGDSFKVSSDYRNLYVTAPNNSGRIGKFKARSRQHGPARTSANRTLRTKPSKSR